MSPIGRVFIVINLILAGTFVGFAGTYLQKQHNFKQLYEQKSTEFEAAKSTWNAERQGLQDTVNKAEVAKAALDNQLSNSRNDAQRLSDENTRLNAKISSLDADVKGLASNANAMRKEVEAAFAEAKNAYQLATDAQAKKDQAVRERDDAVAKLRDANTNIEELKGTVAAREASIQTLSEEKANLDLLVSVAKTKGFLESMAVPAVAGTVSQVDLDGRLVTILIDRVDDQAVRQLAAGDSFAIYSGNVYKGDARVTKVGKSEAGTAYAFCRVDRPVPGAKIQPGDSASTQTN